jgi:hypothetical protein
MIQSIPLRFFALLFCASLFLLSCHKSDREKETEMQSSRDMSLAMDAWIDIFRQADIFAGAQPDLNTVPGTPVNTTCATISVVPALPNPSFPKVLTVDYGSTDCTCPDGAKRRGQLIVSMTGNYRDSLTAITIYTNGYFLNGNSIAGTYTIKNKGRNAKGNKTFVEQVLHATCQRPGSLAVNWNFSGSREKIGGDTTALVFDDVYLLSGTATATSSKGASFAVYINQPLQFSLYCPWIVSGTLYLNPANLPSRFVNYGTGNCDNQADVWIFGSKYTLYLD